MKSIALLFCLMLIFPVAACEPSILGEWKSDGPATMDFARTRAKLEPRQEAFLAALMGKMTVTISERELHLRLPDLEVSINGELKPLEGFEERKDSKVIFCNSSEAVILTGSEAERQDTTTYYFIGPDTVWTYMGTNHPDIPDLHLREYFSRVR
jgi:hypothetical protein